ncbi:hypothetical protein [Streptomyces youssoufiensis]
MAFCSWHRGEAVDAVPVRIIEQTAGPGRSVYACLACCRYHRLTPIARGAAAPAGQIQRRT